MASLSCRLAVAPQCKRSYERKLFRDSRTSLRFALLIVRIVKFAPLTTTQWHTQPPSSPLGRFAWCRTRENCGRPRRASPAPVSEQPRGEFASPHAPTGAAPARVQITGPSAAVPLGLWAHRPTFPPTSSSLLRTCLSSRKGEQISYLAGNHSHGTGCLKGECGPHYH
jgi:hypothetical protein